MNRYGYVPLSNSLENEFDIKKTDIGGLMTGFYIAFVFASVLFGYLGDRYSRKTILSISLLFETLSMFLITFAESHRILYIGRLSVGFFQASFVTIAPTIVADMYDSMARTKYLTIFSIAGPIGVGLCFCISSFLNPIFQWRMTLRLYAVLTGFACLMFAFVIPEYERGAAEKNNLNNENQAETEQETEQLKTSDVKSNDSSSFIDDLIYMVKVKSYTMSNLVFGA